MIVSSLALLKIEPSRFFLVDINLLLDLVLFYSLRLKNILILGRNENTVFLL